MINMANKEIREDFQNEVYRIKSLDRYGSAAELLLGAIIFRCYQLKIYSYRESLVDGCPLLLVQEESVLLHKSARVASF